MAVSTRASSRADSSATTRRLRRTRHRLVALLTFLTGCADAIGFLALGGAFSSVMTGNMALLGMSAGTSDGSQAISSGSAIAAYALGVLVGGRVAGHVSSTEWVWPPAVTRALAVELVALLGLLLTWEMTLGGRSYELQLCLLMLLAAALGIQGSAVQRFGVPGLSSTYLTGTLTSLIAGVAARQPGRSLLPSASVLLALVLGAAVGAAVVLEVPALAPVLVVVPLTTVIAASLRLVAAERTLRAEAGQGDGAG